MRTADFDFELPPELIADEPARPRDAARLLDVRDRMWTGHVRDLPDLLNPGDLLVYNDTRVNPARLTGKRGEVKVEVDPPQARRRRRLACLRQARQAAAGRRDHRVRTRPVGGGDGEARSRRHSARFSVAGGELMAALHRYGVMPLPPYIRRPEGARPGREDYQTVSPRATGAVAAPTAGLHFTPDLLARLEARGIRRGP